MNQRFLNRLSFRQARNTVLVAILIGIIATIAEQAFHIGREREEMREQTRQVINLVMAPAAKAAYVLDTELANEVLTGLLSYSAIYEARLSDELGNTLAHAERQRPPSERHWLDEMFFGRDTRINVPLMFAAQRRPAPTQVGTLSVLIDSQTIAARFFDRAGLSVFFNLGGNIVLGLLLFMMFHRMVTRPILSLARDLALVRPEEPSAHRLAVPDGHDHTEIGFLVGRTNELLSRYDDTLKQRDTYMDDLNAARQRAEDASQAKSQFLTTISHELRTPLNAIIGFSQIIRDDLATSEKQVIYSDFSAEIYNSGQHLLNVINDIIDFSNIETGRMDANPEPVDVKAMFESCTRLSVARMETAGLNFLTEVAPDTPHVFADPRALKQILMHLLSNAVKFTVVGGTITLSARGTDAGIEIVVGDTGIGIAKSDLPKIFQPFWQAAPVLSRQHEGTGLGLTMVKSLVELNGGTIEVDSTPNHGTRFIVILPVHRPRERALTQSVADAETAPLPATDQTTKD